MSNKSIAKNGIFNAIYQVSNIVFPLIISMYVSLMLQPEGIGKVAFAQNVASYFVMYAALGIPTYGVREISKVKDSVKNTNKVFTELWIINLVTTILSTAVYVVLVFIVPRFREDTLLFAVFTIQIFMNIINIDWFYQGKEDYKYITIRSIVIKALSVVALIIFVRDKDDYVIYAIISILAITANYIFNMVHVRKYVHFDFGGLEFKRHIKPLIILGLSIFLSSLYSKVDITMLGSMADDASTGLYSNAHKIAEILIGLCTAVTGVFLPRLCYFYINDRKQFDDLVTYGVKIVAFLSIPMTVGLFILADQAINIMYGESFISAATTLRYFTPLIIIKSFGNLLCYQLVIATGNEKKRLPAYIVASVMNIVLNYFMIPILSQNGAAIASVISELIVNGIQFVAVYKLLKLKLPIKEMAKSLFASALMGVAIFVVLKLFSNIYVQAIVGFIVGVIVFAIVSIVLKNEIMFKAINVVKEKLHHGKN